MWRFDLNGHTIGFHTQVQKFCFVLLSTKQIVPCESYAEEVSFQWSHHSK